MTLPRLFILYCISAMVFFLIDILWGIILCGTVSVAGFFIDGWLLFKTQEGSFHRKGCLEMTSA